MKFILKVHKKVKKIFQKNEKAFARHEALAYIQQAFQREREREGEYGGIICKEITEKKKR